MKPKKIPRIKKYLDNKKLGWGNPKTFEKIQKSGPVQNTLKRLKTGNEKTSNTKNLLSSHERTEKVSIIIPAYKAQDFIEECLDSIENQTYFQDYNGYEILLGIDACEDTLKKVKEIRHKYRNLHVFMMDSNEGPYVTKNTLIPIAQYDKILFFDADDIMMDHMVNEIIGYDEDVVRFGFHNFIKDKTKYTVTLMCAHGVFLSKKIVFDKTGGFMDWKCAADTEFLTRSNKFIKTKKHLKSALFLRRTHNDSLTRAEETKMGSSLRNSYKSLIKNKYNINEIKINPTINTYKEV